MDFTLKDLLFPKRDRTAVFISGIINLCLYKWVFLLLEWKKNDILNGWFGDFGLIMVLGALLNWGRGKKDFLFDAGHPFSVHPRMPNLKNGSKELRRWLNLTEKCLWWVLAGLIGCSLKKVPKFSFIVVLDGIIWWCTLVLSLVGKRWNVSVLCPMQSSYFLFTRPKMRLLS